MLDIMKQVPFLNVKIDFSRESYDLSNTEKLLVSKNKRHRHAWGFGRRVENPGA